MSWTFDQANYPMWHGILPMPAFFRDSDQSLFLAAGEGTYAIDQAGRRYLDARSSMWNLTLGYSCTPVKEAMRRQLDVLPSGFPATIVIPGQLARMCAIARRKSAAFQV